MIRKYFVYFLVLAAVCFWGLSIIGLFNSYSPVPFWDMWGGYLKFYIEASQGDITSWWRTHNEHRIILSRMFFWIDLSMLNGSVWFLLFLNYLFVAISCLIFFFIIKDLLIRNNIILTAFIVTWLISWSQHENLTWGFQSQFFLAQLLPLIAFFLLYKSCAADGVVGKYFLGACFFGILSIGTMANGVIALPLMTFYAIILRFGWRWVVILAALSMVVGLAYFYDYNSPAHHGSLAESLKNNTFGLILYVLTYIGSPFFYIASGWKWSLAITQFAGAIMIAISAYFACITLRNRNKFKLELALLFFILYVGGTALGTAGGRLIFGVEQALSSRYVTPSLMAWAALFVLISAKFFVSYEKINWKLCVPIFLMVIGMLPMQLKALDYGVQSSFDRNIAGLAIAMGVNDQLQISNVYPSSEQARLLGKIASDKGLSYFSRSEFKNINLGKPVDGFSGSYDACQGYIDYVESVNSDGEYLRVSGWIFNKAKNISPSPVWLINDEGNAVGYGLMGQYRPDVAKAVSKEADFSGFKGYVFSNVQGSVVRVFSLVNNCGFSSKIPVNLFNLSAYKEGDSITVGDGKVVSNRGWNGGDYQKSQISGLNIQGSFVNSDADKGEVVIRLKRGDKMLYRSGPSYGNQYLQFNESNEKILLPTSLDWQVIEFSSKALPDDFFVTINDNGDGWGEWSAIGLLSEEIKK